MPLPSTMSKFYYKEKVIGSGTFGNVWLVKSKMSHNFFVLKEVNLSSMNAAESQQALNEVTVLSRCRHRNIIKYKDAVVDHKKGMLSIIMEYADGGDLYSLIIKQESVHFKEQTVITWFTQICLALQYIHHKSILHRDLKTKNIFLTRDGQIKVGDFGIARCLMETNELATTAIGTPYYLSPEICQRKPYNHKSDIWALGCVLFEMAALSHPFQACNFPHLLTLILSGKRKELPGHCSSLIKDLVELLLNENAEERPSVDEILALPPLQPYLSEVWVMQNSTGSTLSRMLKEKISLRRHSSGNSVKNSNEIALKRRASVSSVESRSTKNRFGFVSRVNSVPGQKLTANSRSLSLKERKNSPIGNSIKKDHFSTYKVLHPISLKKTKILNNGTNSSQPKIGVSSSGSKYSIKNDESDRGYQSEEVLKGISEKILDFDISEASIKTSTKKYGDAPNFEIEQSVVSDEVFDSNAGREKVSFEKTNVNYSNYECCHSQCQQCMLDMLWKNRIRGTIGPLVQTNEKTELIRKLRAVFSGDLFDNVYYIMISNWETSENGHSPKSLKNIINLLNYSQLQHLPLMMQLIQLDLIPK